MSRAQRQPRPIYGDPAGVMPADTSCMNLVHEALEELLSALAPIYDTVWKLFPSHTVSALSIGNMTMKSSVGPIMFVRLKWIEMHPGEKFRKLPEQMIQLKDIYLSIGQDWIQDPYFKPVDLSLPERSGKEPSADND